MIRILYLSSDGNISTDIQLGEISKLLKEEKGLLWLDLMEEPPTVCEPILRETFGFHHLAVEDALRETHIPKVDDWENYLYIVLNAIFLQSNREVNSVEIDIFLGQNFLVTYHESFIPSIDHIWERSLQDGHLLRRGAVRLLYRLTDHLVEDALPVIEEMGSSLGRLEDEIFKSPTASILEEILLLKRNVLQTWQVVTPQREVLNKLARDEFVIIDPTHRVYFRDVYDHIARLDDVNMSIRDQVSDTIDLYLSTTSNRMNEVMKTLTIITTFFMPLSFLAGFFGMNFFRPSEVTPTWTSTGVLILAIAVMILLPTGMFLWIKRRGWM
jgi:magnesium transporter